MNQIYLYGILGASDAYRVARYEVLEGDYISVASMKREAAMMKLRQPNIQHVYAIDQRYGLRRDYVNAFKQCSVESWAIFKDILECEGLQIF